MNIKKLLKNAKSVLILPSNPADMDGVGSSLMLKKYLVTLGKKCRVIFLYPFTEQQKEFFGILPFINELEFLDTYDLLTNKIFDAVVFLDGPNIVQFYDRSFHNTPPKLDAYGLRILIDHHEMLVENIANHTLQSTEASSTAELLLDKVIPRREVTSEMAELALAAIYADTGVLRWKYTPTTFKVISELLKKGADPKKIINTLSSKTKKHFDILSYAIENTIYNEKLGCTFLYMPIEKMRTEKWDDEKLDMLKVVYFSDFAIRINGYPLGMLLIENKKNSIKIGARGNTLNNKINLPQMFLKMNGNGGGHFNASGTKIEGKFEEIKKMLMKVIHEELNEGRQ